MLSERILDQIGNTVYEAVRTWDAVNNIGDHPPWKKASADTKAEVINRMTAILKDPRGGDATVHNLWLAESKKEGWVYGKEFNEAKKMDPLCVPFHQLPNEYKARERLFRAATLSLSHF